MYSRSILFYLTVCVLIIVAQTEEKNAAGDINETIDLEHKTMVKTRKKVIEIRREETTFDEQIELDDPEPPRE